MDIPLAWLAQLEGFAVLLARVVGVVTVAPLFGGQGVPVLTRVGFAALLAAVLLGPVQHMLGELPWLWGDPVGYALLMGGEFLIGAFLGFIVLLMLVAVQIAGQLLDLPMGFGMVNVLDPQTGTYVPVMGQFKFALAMLVFFGVNAHHWLLRALADSYRFLPVGWSVMDEMRARLVVQAMSQAFVLGVRIALPVIAASFLTDVALGIVSRAVPQINVFITGYPVKILAGMAVIILVIPAYVVLLSWVFGDGGDMVGLLWRFLAGR